MKKYCCDVKNLGLALGFSFGIYAFFIGIVAWLFGWGRPLVQLASSWYIGFTPTFLGSIIGGIWAFIDGFIGGVLIAWFYNKFQKEK